MQSAMFRFLSITLTAALLSACGGGGTGTPPVKPPAHTGGTTQLKFTLSFPAKNATSARKGATSARKSATGGAPRKANSATTGYNSYSTKSVGLYSAAAAGLTGVAAPQITLDVTPGLVANNGTCTTPAGVGGAYSCTLLVPAPVGFDDIQITEWDGTAGTGNLLAVYTNLNTAVEQNQVNSLNVQPNGVVAGGKIALTTTSLVSGTPGSTTIGIDATDADGNPITGNNGYVDKLNAAVTFTVTATVSPNTANADFNGGTLTLNNYTDPSVANSFPYSANSGIQIANVGFALTSNSANVTATQLFGNTLNFTASSGSGVGAGSQPQATELATALTNPPDDIVAGADGNLYVGEGANGAQVVPGTSAVTEFNFPSVEVGMAAAPDGDVWFINSFGFGADMGRFNEAAAPAFDTGTACPCTFNSVTVGPDQLIYASVPSSSSIAIFDYTSLDATNSVLAGGSPQGIAAGPNVGGHQTVWWADQNVNGSGGSGTSYYDITANSVTQNSATVFTGVAQNLITGRDGNIYVTQTAPNAIVEVNPQSSGAILHTYPLSATPTAIINGPDGNVWVAENTGFIARLSLEGGTNTDILSEFGANSGLANDDYTGLAAGSDGNIWFTDATAKKVGKLTTP